MQIISFSKDLLPLTTLYFIWRETKKNNIELWRKIFSKTCSKHPFKFVLKNNLMGCFEHDFEKIFLQSSRLIFLVSLQIKKRVVNGSKSIEKLIICMVSIEHGEYKLILIFLLSSRVECKGFYQGSWSYFIFF